MSYKKIKIGFNLDKKSAKSQLDEILKSLDSEKLVLDMEIKGEAKKTLSDLSKMLDVVNAKMDKGMTLKGLTQSANKATKDLKGVQGEIIKTTEKFNNATKEWIKTEVVADSIGKLVEMQTKAEAYKNGQKKGQPRPYKNENREIAKITNDYQKQNDLLSQMSKSQERLNELQSQGLVSQEKINDLKQRFSNEGNFKTNSDLKESLNEIKVLENESKRLKDSLDSDKKQGVVSSYKELNKLLDQEYAKKKQLISAGDQESQSLKTQLATIKDKQKVVANEMSKKGWVDEREKIAYLEREKVLRDEIQNVINKQSDRSNKIDNDKNRAENLQKEVDAYNKLNKLMEREFALKSQLLKAKGENEKDTLSVQVQDAINKRIQQQNNMAKEGISNLQKENEYTERLATAQEKLNVVKSRKNDSNKNDVEKLKAEQIEVQKLISNKIRLLEIEKQQMQKRYGSGYDSSKVDEYINKLKGLENINLRELRGQFQDINTGMKEASEQARNAEGAFSSFGSKIKTAFAYISGAFMFGGIQATIQDAIGYIKYLDQSFTDMAMTMDISKTKFKEMSNSIDQMSKAMGMSSIEVHDIAKILANSYRNI